MNIHTLATFSDIVDIHIGTENHRMPYWSHCRNERVKFRFYFIKPPRTVLNT